MDNFVKTLIEEVKSLGVFDEFRFNCCLADVDTKPAYQNVRNRVETAVKDFLSKQKWTPDTNKVQLREQLRKHLLDTDVLIKGVDQIVDQVVNPKVATIFEPKIESIAYKYMGITPPPPPANAPPPRPPPLLPAPPLPPYALGNGSSLLNVETTASLLPTDLEQISPDSDRATVKSDLKEESKDELPPGVDDEDTSPLVEPSNESKPVESINGSLNTSDSRNKDLANDSRDAGASQVSQLSQVSSDSRLTIASSTDSAVEGNSQQPTPVTPNMTANISEEAQMPKFSENSSETCDADSNGRRMPLHFDINQDAIRFEGTERKNSLSENNNGGPQILSIEDAIMSEVKAVIDDANHAAIELDAQPDPEPKEKHSSPKLDELRAPQIVDNITNTLAEATSVVQTNPNIAEKKEEPTQEPNQAKSEEVKEEVPKSECEIPEVPVPDIVATPKDEAIKSSESTSSPASSSHSKRPHSKDKDKEKEKDRRHHSHSGDKQSHRSRERDRDHSRDKSNSKHSSTSSSKHSSSHSSSSKHRSSTSSSSKSSSNRSNRESSSSKRSSSANMPRHESSSSSSQKKHKSKSSSSSSRSDRDREKDGSSHSHSRSHNGSSSSSNSKKSERDRDRSHNKSSSSSTAPPPPIQDDHNEAKAKIQKRRSSDSNDEGKPPGSGGPSNTSLLEDVGSKGSASTNPEHVQNGNGLNGSNGNGSGSTNGKHNDAKESMDTNKVIIVSDMLQQSSTSFIELSATAAQKPEIREETIKAEEAKKEEISVTPAEIESESTPILEKPSEPQIEAVETQKEAKDQEKLKKENQIIATEQMKSEENGNQTTNQETASKEQQMESKELQINSEDKQTNSEYQQSNSEDQIKSEDQQIESKEIKSGEQQLESKDEKIKLEEQQINTEEIQSKEEQIECKEDLKSKDLEVKTNEEQVELITPQADELADRASVFIPKENAKTSEIIKTITDETTSNDDQSQPKDVEMLNDNNSEILETSDHITHFEENGEEFKDRLQLINHLIENSKKLLTQLSADEPQVLVDARALRRTTSKRRMSKEMTPIEQISPSSSSSSISSACSSPAKTNPSKRLRRDEIKSSPTTSETSINSKENEVVEKQEQVGLLSTRRLSQKLCQQQRYTNDDLYKPRPVLSQRSRRRGLDSIL